MENGTGRNSYDVVMELVNTHLKEVRQPGELLTEEELERIYLKYYQLVQKHR